MTIKGKKVPIIAQSGKVGFMHILNRDTGEPIFGIKETPVTASQVPGEQSAPTQPIPLKPPPLVRMSFTMDDLVTAADTTEEHAAACRDFVEKAGGLYNTGPFTPWLYHEQGAPPKSSVIFPGPIGGSDWGGSAADPKLGYIFVSVNEYGDVGWIQKASDSNAGRKGKRPGRFENSSTGLEVIWVVDLRASVKPCAMRDEPRKRGAELALSKTTMG